MKVLFFIKALSIHGGGAERVLVDVVNALSSRGHLVYVATFDPIDSHPYYALDSSVKLMKLGVGNIEKTSHLFEAAMRVLAMRRVVLEVSPEIAVGFMHSSYVLLGFSLLGTKIPVVASEHIGIAHYDSRPIQKILVLLATLLVKKITVVSEQIRLEFPDYLQRKMLVIRNPVSFVRPELVGYGKVSRTQKVLLSVGRFRIQKNFNCLISAFARIADSFPDWKLRIVGDGELRPAMELQIRELGLIDRVELPGSVRDMSSEYLNADVFVLPSLYESFGLATAEAMLHGLPAVGFEDCSGTNQLIKHDENGLLVGSKDRITMLAHSLNALMIDPEYRMRLANASKAWLIRKHGIDTVLDSWEGLLADSCRIKR